MCKHISFLLHLSFRLLPHPHFLCFVPAPLTLPTPTRRPSPILLSTSAASSLGPWTHRDCRVSASHWVPLTPSELWVCCAFDRTFTLGSSSAACPIVFSGPGVSLRHQGVCERTARPERQREDLERTVTSLVCRLPFSWNSLEQPHLLVPESQGWPFAGWPPYLGSLHLYLNGPTSQPWPSFLSLWSSAVLCTACRASQRMPTFSSLFTSWPWWMYLLSHVLAGPGTNPSCCLELPLRTKSVCMWSLGEHAGKILPVSGRNKSRILRLGFISCFLAQSRGPARPLHSRPSLAHSRSESLIETSECVSPLCSCLVHTRQLARTELGLCWLVLACQVDATASVSVLGFLNPFVIGRSVARSYFLQQEPLMSFKSNLIHKSSDSVNDDRFLYESPLQDPTRRLEHQTDRAFLRESQECTQTPRCWLAWLPWGPWTTQVTSGHLVAVLKCPETTALHLGQRKVRARGRTPASLLLPRCKWPWLGSHPVVISDESISSSACSSRTCFTSYSSSWHMWLLGRWLGVLHFTCLLSSLQSLVSFLFLFSPASSDPHFTDASFSLNPGNKKIWKSLRLHFNGDMGKHFGFPLGHLALKDVA